MPDHDVKPPVKVSAADDFELSQLAAFRRRAQNDEFYCGKAILFAVLTVAAIALIVIGLYEFIYSLTNHR